MTTRTPGSARGGFSLIELLIVVAIMASLTGGAMIRIEWVTERARSDTLRHNLRTLRQAIDDFHADRGRYPATLAELVESRYLREVPVDPTTMASDTWVTVPSAPGQGDVFDVRSPPESRR